MRRRKRILSFVTLFEMSWTVVILMNIVAEANQYATMVDREGRLPSRAYWKDITVAKLKDFLAITLYIGMKKQSNVKSYWMRPPTMMEENHGRRHCIMMDNYFTSIEVFEELAAIGTYATKTVGVNQVGIL
jgi:hypothetical protein